MPNLIEQAKSGIMPEFEGVSFNFANDHTIEATITDPSKLPTERLLLTGEKDNLPHLLTKGLRFRINQDGGVKLITSDTNVDVSSLLKDFSYIVLDLLEGKRERVTIQVESPEYPFY